MREHLPVVLAAFLDVDHKDLLHPECGLREIVKLKRRPKHQAWVVAPQRNQQVIELAKEGRRRRLGSILDENNKSPSPVNEVVEQKVCLLREPAIELELSFVKP